MHNLNIAERVQQLVNIFGNEQNMTIDQLRATTLYQIRKVVLPALTHYNTDDVNQHTLHFIEGLIRDAINNYTKYKVNPTWRPDKLVYRRNK